MKHKSEVHALVAKIIAVTHMELVNDEGELIATGGAAFVVG